MENHSDPLIPPNKSLFSAQAERGPGMSNLTPSHKRYLEKDPGIIIRLITWFVRDQQQAKISEIDLDKGILLVWPAGAGKTALMALCRFLLAADRRHSIRSC